jgi:hypothetical protein
MQNKITRSVSGFNNEPLEIYFILRTTHQQLDFKIFICCKESLPAGKHN